MDVEAGFLGRVEEELWPLVEGFLGSRATAGLAVAVVRDDEVVARGFGVRDVRSGAPVTAETMFHLASVSKPFVATAVVSLAGAGRLDLDAPITDWVPEFTLADGREADVTARGLLSHSSGLPDVTDYGWHDPQLGDDALSEFARSLSGWRLKKEPGKAFSYSNAGFELLGLLLSRVTGTTFEEAMRQELLVPLGMRNSTFLRAEVPEGLAAQPHVGMPLAVPEGAYPYTRRHAPSSTMHSNLVELTRWVTAHFAGDGQQRLDHSLVELMSQPVMQVGRPPWQEAESLGWALGTYRGLRTLTHNGMDPGFGARLVLIPERRTGVVVLANSNTIPVWTIATAALDLTFAGSTEVMGSGLPPVVVPVAEVLATKGPEAAKAAFREADKTEYDFDDDGFVDAVWGAIELHRPNLAWPVLRVWTDLRPDSSQAWTMTGWAYLVEGNVEAARSALQRALDLDPGNDEAAQFLRTL